MKDIFGLTSQEEITIESLNAITHGIASLISILGIALLLFKNEVSLFNHYWFAYIIYGISMLCLFINSTVYHSFSFTRYKNILQKFDHASIYLFIAGTYTPYIMIKINSQPLIIMLIMIWILAIAGIIFEIIWTNRFPLISTLLYLGLGWLSIFMIYPLIKHMASYGILLLVLGGIIYSIGTYFYRKKHNKWMHVLWHLFVMAAALSMYLSIYFYT